MLVKERSRSDEKTLEPLLARWKVSKPGGALGPQFVAQRVKSSLFGLGNLHHYFFTRITFIDGRRAMSDTPSHARLDPLANNTGKRDYSAAPDNLVMNGRDLELC